MSILDRLDKYIIDKEYKIIIKDNYLNIINYIEIKDFSNNIITIKSIKGITTITGDNLVITKMQDNELLITGTIKKVEL